MWIPVCSSLVDNTFLQPGHVTESSDEQAVSILNTLVA